MFFVGTRRLRVVLIVIVQPGPDKNSGDDGVRGTISAVEEGATAAAMSSEIGPDVTVSMLYTA